ncbi:MAG: TldD/PmbA family protein [Defluviitaleaceae bacterium]|nr:TldD/PmbA family protein [Defluviitaleaceae bacterium]MCL2238439.1 TldD/PmbA family protein [Defluviitaleaceae bacterium]
MLDKKTAEQVIKNVTSQTQNYAQVRIHGSAQGTTRFAKSEISQNVAITDTSVALTVFNGKKEATASTNVLTEAGLAQLAKDADALLAHVPEGEFEAFPFSQEAVPERANGGALAQSFGTAGRAALIKEGMGHVKDGYTASGALVLDQKTVALGDSKGAFRFAAFDEVSFNTVVTHADGADGAGECISYTSAPDIIAQFKKAQATAEAARNPVPAQLGAHTVVLSPLAFGDLLTFMAYVLNAKAVDDGFSFAAGKLGQKVFGENLTIRDDVSHPELQPLFFDMESNPRQALPLIEKGIVKNLLYDNKRAAKHGVKPTGHCAQMWGGMGAIPLNVLVEAGTSSLADIIASTPKGIFVNEFHYTNFVNPRNLQITGLTRNGAFLIEDGKLGAPISTVRFTESLLDAFCHITAISSEREKVSGLGIGLIPAVRIENFHFTSKA